VALGDDFDAGERDGGAGWGDDWGEWEFVYGEGGALDFGEADALFFGESGVDVRVGDE
jgi:hypothetical protein